MLGLLRTRRARRRAVAALAPHVEASRCALPALDDSRWLDPFVLGFLAMAVTEVAGRALSSDELALVQAGAIAEATGADPGLVGQEIVLRSLAGDAAFAEGCRAADGFARAALAENAERFEEARALWRDAVDPRLSPD